MIQRIVEPWKLRQHTFVNEDEWREFRRNSIGASDSPAIFGVGYANQSPITVWNSKVNKVDSKPDEGLLKLMRRGQRMEPVIAAEFEDETGVVVEDLGHYTVFQHPTIDWMTATLDRIAVHDECGPIPLELKNINGRFRHLWSDDCEIPLKFQVQTQHQMVVAGTSHAYLACLIGGDELVVRLLERNDRFIDVMLKKLERFWDYVKREEMPPVDESEATGRLLNKLFPQDDSTTAHLPAEAYEWDSELTEAKQDLKHAQDRKRAAENKIKAAIGDATYGALSDGSRYSWKTQKRAGYTVEPSECRVLRKLKS